MRWGLIPWHWKKPLRKWKLATFNARVETVVTKPMFRDAFKRRRCLIPASGYGDDGKQLVSAAAYGSYQSAPNPRSAFCTPNDRLLLSDQVKVE